MTTLLRNSLLATSINLDDTIQQANKDKELSKIIPPVLPNIPDNSKKDIPLVNVQQSTKSTSSASLNDFKKIYEQLKSETGRELLGNDPLLQKNAIDKINEFLTRYPQTKANPNFNENNNKPWVDLPVKTIYYKTIQTLIDLINDIADIISASEVDGYNVTRRKVVEAFFIKERRIYVGIIFIFLSFVVYFIDSAV